MFWGLARLEWPLFNFHRVYARRARAKISFKEVSLANLVDGYGAYWIAGVVGCLSDILLNFAIHNDLVNLAVSQ